MNVMSIDEIPTLRSIDIFDYDEVCSNELREDMDDPFVLPGTVQNYNLTFDLSWKLMKEILTEYHGVTDFASGSPKLYRDIG